MSPTRAPGLIKQENWPLQRRRLLAQPGQVLVRPGQWVAPADVIAQAQLPGRIVPVDVAASLSLPPAEVPGRLVRRVGDTVQAGEVLARNSELFGLLRAECLAPCAGKVMSVSALTGQVLLQAAAEPVAVQAYLGGEVIAVIPDRGAVVANRVTFVQGVYGLGNEVWGELAAAVSEPDLDLTVDNLDGGLSGKVVLGGARVSFAALAKAATLGIVAVVTGSVSATDLHELREAGWDSTIGDDDSASCTLVITEGFGQLAMQPATFELLRARQGDIASVSGLTQLRAGVVRPEVVVPRAAPGAPHAPGSLDSAGSAASDHRREPPSPGAPESVAWERGDRIKVVREPYLGRLGTVRDLPPALFTLPSGVCTHVAEIELEDGELVTLALANLEPL
jgi:hypothetical protein